ncbi:hypothetical protein CPB83DRAFT_902343 [Crepidotus variabilis]|uniref:Uncharacterized protein n=1 Tax=Crepidotus variabilis TaxID=179855 RepID=A0A9P6ESW8_9AGAR|nr:hypothetical protein CPB83DRAFT_902343 [Crepidotus variabilis]
MHPSLRCCSARAHTPLIKFIGKRTWPSSPDARHAHPAAPAEFKQHFSDFLKKMESSKTEAASKPSSNADTYDHFWEAPGRFWKPRVRQLSEAEMDAIMSGGASSY